MFCRSQKKYTLDAELFLSNLPIWFCYKTVCCLLRCQKQWNTKEIWGFWAQLAFPAEYGKCIKDHALNRRYTAYGEVNQETNKAEKIQTNKQTNENKNKQTKKKHFKTKQKQNKPKKKLKSKKQKKKNKNKNKTKQKQTQTNKQTNKKQTKTNQNKQTNKKRIP